MAPERDDNLIYFLLFYLMSDRYDDDDPYFDEMMMRLSKFIHRRARQDSSDIPVDMLLDYMRHRRFRGPRRRTAVFSEFSDGLIREITGRVRSELSDEISLISRNADEIYDLQWALSNRLDISQIKMKRTVPIRVYIKDKMEDYSRELDAISSAIDETLGDEIFEAALELPSEDGSIWKRWWVRSKEFLTQEEINDRLTKLERAGEIRIIDKPQAEANKDHAEAFQKIVKSLEKVDSACVQLGNILIVKHSPTHGGAMLISRTLTPLEMKEIEKNQSLLRNPESIIERLEGICREKISA